MSYSGFQYNDTVTSTANPMMQDVIKKAVRMETLLMACKSNNVLIAENACEGCKKGDSLIPFPKVTHDSSKTGKGFLYIQNSSENSSRFPLLIQHCVEDQRSPLLAAIYYQSRDVVKYILDQYKENAIAIEDDIDKYGETCLHGACRHNDTSMIIVLLKYNIDNPPKERENFLLLKKDRHGKIPYNLVKWPSFLYATLEFGTNKLLKKTNELYDFSTTRTETNIEVTKLHQIKIITKLIEKLKTLTNETAGGRKTKSRRKPRRKSRKSQPQVTTLSKLRG